MKNTFSVYASMGALALCGSACNIVEETVIEEATVTTVRKAIIQDSFERDTISEDATTLKWRGFIWDWGSPVIGNSERNVAAVILGSDTLGEASDGDKALYFYGRDGASVHDIFLITQTFDLSEADKVEIHFDYLTVSINDTQDVNDEVTEYLKVEVCSGSPEECGTSDSGLSASALREGPWQTVFETDGSEMPNGLNGKNHVSSDWQEASVTLDISQFPLKDQFTFRLSAKMRDGFKNNNLNNEVEDLIAVDNIEATGIQYEVSGGGDNSGGPGGNPNDGEEECDESLPFSDPNSCLFIPIEVEI